MARPGNCASISTCEASNILSHARAEKRPPIDPPQITYSVQGCSDHGADVFANATRSIEVSGHDQRVHENLISIERTFSRARYPPCADCSDCETERDVETQAAARFRNCRSRCRRGRSRWSRISRGREDGQVV